MRTEEGDVSVPITHAYNHHYCAYMSGAMSEMKQVRGHYSFLTFLGLNCNLFDIDEGLHLI